MSKSYKDYYNEILDASTITPSKDTVAAKEKLTELEAQIPTSPYKGTHTEAIDKMVSNYLGRDKFNFNPNNDATFQQLRDTYLSGGKTAMKDTLGSGAVLSGGNNNSSAQVAAQQVYNNYAKGVSDAIPTLEAQAYSRYQTDNAQKLKDIGLLQSLDETEYGRHQQGIANLMNYLTYYGNKYGTLSAEDSAAANRKINVLGTLAGMGQSDYQFDANLDFTKEQYADSKEQTALANAQNLAWQKMGSLIMPTDEELKAIGMTKKQAQSMMDYLRTSSVSSGGGSGNSSKSSGKANSGYTSTGLKNLWKNGDYDTFMKAIATDYGNYEDAKKAAVNLGINGYEFDYIEEGLVSPEQVDYMLKNYGVSDMPSTVSGKNALTESEFYAFGNINSAYNTYSDYLEAMFGKYIDF